MKRIVFLAVILLAASTVNAKPKKHKEKRQYDPAAVAMILGYSQQAAPPQVQFHPMTIQQPNPTVTCNSYVSGNSIQTVCR
jgi:hypothetical protein